MKAFYLSLFSFLFSLATFAQNNSTTDGNWSNASNWSSGVPTATQTVNVGNNMILDQNISIANFGKYTVTGSITDPIGGPKYDIDLVTGSTLDIDGNIKIEGSLSLIGLCNFTIRSGDTLIVGGDASINGISSFNIENNAVFIVKGDFEAKNFTFNVNNGTMLVEGNATFNNSSWLIGNGSFQSNGQTTISNGSNVFGSTTGCPSGCKYGTGAGLPISLSTFTAQLDPINRGIADIKWTTASEINNNYFTVSYSTDGQHFEEITKVDGAGNSNQELTYKIEVPLKSATNHYFILSQTDFDGKSEEFDPIVLKTPSKFSTLYDKNEFVVYPNPSNGEKLQLEGINLEKGNYHLLLFNSNGKLLIDKNFEIKSNEGRFQTELINNRLAKGLYFLNINNNGDDFSQKIIVR